MKKSLLNHKIPSVLGIGLIVIGVVVTTALVKGPSLLQIKAGPSDEPKNIEITNISDSSFTVTYTTDNSTLGTITFGKDPNTLDQTTLDDRDQLTQKVNNYSAHSITANSLEPNTTYYFKITSGSKDILDNAKPFNVKTGPTISSPPSSQNPMSGKALNPDGSIPSDGLVIVNIDGAEKITTYLRKDGSFMIPLNNLRTNDLASYFDLDENTNINIKIKSANLSSSADVMPNQISPVPIITLSNNYEFTEETEPMKKIDSTHSASFKDMIFPKLSKPKRVNSSQ